MPYWQLFYHLVWSTKNRDPLLTPKVERTIYGLLTSKASGIGGVVYTLGGTVDHVHLVIAIPPSIAVSTFIGQVKATASTRFNKSNPSDTRFQWQAEYGAFSFDAKRLPHVIAYVEDQKQHHAQGTIIPILERRMEQNLGPGLLREKKSTYLTQSETWWAEMLELETL